MYAIYIFLGNVSLPDRKITNVTCHMSHVTFSPKTPSEVPVSRVYALRTGKKCDIKH